LAAIGQRREQQRFVAELLDEARHQLRARRGIAGPQNLLQAQ